MTKHNILVTGGAGFIGSHLVDALIERGHRVRILDSLVEQVHGPTAPPHLNTQAEFVRADVCDAEAVLKALDGIDVVYHQAAEVGVGQSMYEIVRYVKANDLGTAVLLEDMIKRPGQFRKLIVASSMSIYGEGSYRRRRATTVNPFLPANEQLAALGVQMWNRSRIEADRNERGKTALSDIRLRRHKAGSGAILSFVGRLTGSRPLRFDTSMSMGRGRRFRIRIPVLRYLLFPSAERSGADYFRGRRAVARFCPCQRHRPCKSARPRNR